MKTLAGALIALGLFLFVALARADDLPTPEHGQAICEKDGTRCIVLASDIALQNRKMQEAAGTLIAQGKAIDLLEAELKKLRAIKGCAKLEVLPKS